MEEYRKIKDYSNDELKKLYKSYSLYIVTYWFKHLKTYNIDRNLNIINCPTEWEWVHTCVFNSIRISTISDMLNNNEYKDENEKHKLEKKYANKSNDQQAMMQKSQEIFIQSKISARVW